MRAQGIKQELLDKVDFTAEFTELLGPGDGRNSNVRRCFNRAAHERGDKNPSLSFNPSTGGWKCHGCGEKGDLFSLYMKVEGVRFPDAFKHYLQKYGLWQKLTDFKEQSHRRTKRKQFRALTNGDIRSNVTANVRNWLDKSGRERLDFMRERYGITFETLKRYKVGYSKRDSRVWIPVFVSDIMPKNANQRTDTRLTAIVNVRKHDCFRRWCRWFNEETEAWINKGRPPNVDLMDVCHQNYAPWKPVWPQDKPGKVMNVKGHGASYVYPAHVLIEEPAVWLVGGELKALLMIQLGIPAVSFTGGEGSYAREWLPYFMGKNVNVLFDADPGAKTTAFDELSDGEKEFCAAIGKSAIGLSNAERATFRVCKALANNGAFVNAIIWPEQVKSVMPEKGDVTDFLRMAGWNAAALEHLEVYEVERDEDPEIEIRERSISLAEDIPPWDKMVPSKFSGLVEPGNLGSWVRIKSIISGRGEAPYVVPQALDIHCEVGESQMQPKCGDCVLPRMGFHSRVTFPTNTQVEMVGMPQDKIEQDVLKRVGCPRGCRDPRVVFEPAAVELAVLTPTVDMEDDASGDSLDDYEYAHRNCYIIGRDRVQLEENRSYELGGKIMSDPKKGTFTFAATEWHPTQNDIFHFAHDPNMDDALRSALGGETLGYFERRDYLIDDVRDHIVKQIYGQDTMLEAITLSWFLPFVFRLGHHEQERVCPSIMILGDTNVGKSTATGKIMRHYGAGRPHSANSDPTHAGLVGGNLSTGYRMSFTWGVLPTSHRGLVVLDEYNKLDLEVIGKLTNLLSSGIAERTTVNGPRKTKSWVRLLTLCNPRGERRLTSYSDPLQAALQVAGTVQDLGRFEYVFIQNQLPHKVLARYMRRHQEPKRPHRYTREVARYHLRWAWSLSMDRIIFEDSAHVFGRALDLADEFGAHTLMLPAQARFKLARVAAGFATMTFSHDENMNLLVKREHIEMAVKFYQGIYRKYIDQEKSGGGMAAMPDELVRVLDRVRTYRNLRFLTMSDRWSLQDLEDALGHTGAKDFIECAQWHLGIISRNSRWYFPKYDTFGVMIEEYINNRERRELMEA